MRITVVQLSDIHFADGPNWISDKVERIAGATWADDTTSSAYILAVSGDIAYSGKEQEYARARTFFSDLQTNLKQARGNPTVIGVFIPGNHDCDFDRETDTRRLAVNHIANDIATLDPAGDLVRQCLSVQDQFFSFIAAESGKPILPYSERLFRVEDLDLQGFIVRIICYNTAWLSRKKEKQGELAFPTHIVESRLAARPAAHLTMALLHHPYNWLIADNARDLRRIVESTSDIVLTGHEHESSLYLKDMFPSGSIQYFEGAVLQASGADLSGFNVLHIDTSIAVSRLSTFSWRSGMYQSPETGDWEPLNRNKFVTGSFFENKAEYRRYLQDMGTGFTHPHFKGELSREHLFIYPDLIRQSLHKRRHTNPNRANIIDTKDVLSAIWEDQRVLIAGADLAGKTTLAKSLYVDIKNTYGAVPLFISGNGLSATNDTEVRRVLDAAVTEQYGTPQREPIHQLKADRKILIVDDFDRCALSTKGQRLFLDIVRSAFDRIIIFADEFFALEELGHESDETRLFYDFESLQIREFGYYLRGKLIEKWVSLGREHLISKVVLDQEVASHEQLITTLLGRNLLPSHPLIVLTVLQAWEATQTHDIATGSYGYLYETLILQALSKVEFRAPEIDVTMTFLARVAYRMFIADRDTLTDQELRHVSDEYFDYYRTRLPVDLFEKLTAARVLSQVGSDYGFRYPYYYYFFVARYIRDNIGRGDHAPALRAKVQEMADQIHYERYANVLSFYIYLSKDPSAIAWILENAKRIYDEFPPCDFQNGVRFYNELYVEYKPADQLQLPEGPPEANRDTYRKELDRAHAQSEGDTDGTAQPDGRRNEKLKYNKGLSDIVKVNIANKTLQILGQVIRNSPGSLPGDIKREVALEAYALGLRTLTAVLAVPINNLAGLRRYVIELVREYRASRRMPDLLETELEKVADEGIIHLAQAFGFGMIRRISQAVGIKQLEETYTEVLKEHPGNVAVEIVDLAIKLDHFPTAPVGDIKDLATKFQRENNYYSYKVLQDLVYSYLYVRNVDYKTRSQLMNRFKIGAGATRVLVDNPSKRRELSKPRP